MTNKDKLFALDAVADEKLGNALVNCIKELDPGQCPSHEDIATLVDGEISHEKRNIIMNHLSTCDSCYDIFMLALDLQKESLKEFKKKNRPMVLFKPMALAASIAIVIFSIYLFYRAGIPKTSRELMNIKSTEVEKDAAKPQPAASPGFQFENKNKKSDTDDLLSLESVATPSDKKVTQATGEDRLKAPTVEEPRKETQRKKGFFKKTGEVGTDAPTPVQAEEQAPRDEMSIHEKNEGMAVDDRHKLQAAPAFPPKKAKAGIRQSPKEEDREKERQQATPARFAVKKSKADSPPDGKLQKNLAWSQANLLNIQSQQYRIHIPANELRDMFKQSIALTNQLKESLVKIKKEVSKTGDVRKIDAFVQGVTPLISVTSAKDDISVHPNIGYFLAKSEPGSVEHKFFYLARSGWCEPISGCFGMERRRDSQTRIRVEKAAGEADDTGEQRLSQWKSLYPQLTGVFQEVASRTISHLEDSKTK